MPFHLQKIRLDIASTLSSLALLPILGCITDRAQDIPWVPRPTSRACEDTVCWDVSAGAGASAGCVSGCCVLEPHGLSALGCFVDRGSAGNGPKSRGEGRSDIGSESRARGSDSDDFRCQKQVFVREESMAAMSLHRARGRGMVAPLPKEDRRFGESGMQWCRVAQGT